MYRQPDCEWDDFLNIDRGFGKLKKHLHNVWRPHLLCLFVFTWRYSIAMLQLMEFYKSVLNWMYWRNVKIFDLNSSRAEYAFLLQLFLFVLLFLCTGEHSCYPLIFFLLHKSVGSIIALIVESITYGLTLSDQLMGILPGQSCYWFSNSVRVEMLAFRE